MHISDGATRQMCVTAQGWLHSGVEELRVPCPTLNARTSRRCLPAEQVTMPFPASQSHGDDGLLTELAEGMKGLPELEEIVYTHAGRVRMRGSRRTRRTAACGV